MILVVRVSTAAVALLEQNRSEQGISDTFGVRISGQANPMGGLNIALAFTDDPDEEDHRLEAHGTQFYVAPEVSEPLEGTVIDAEGSEPQLTLRGDDPAE